jgi:hypothetical protein
MRRSITIINRSNWPTWLIRWLVTRAAADAGVKWEYTWTQRSTKKRIWCGRGWRNKGNGTVHRRVIDSIPGAVHEHKDHRYASAPVESWPHSPVATLAFLIRHELEHAGDGHPSNWQGNTGRRREADMEMICNATAAEWFNGLSAQWPIIRSEWLAIARKERDLLRDALQIYRDRRKLKAIDNLKRWERRLKLAQSKVQKYRRAVARIEK